MAIDIYKTHAVSLTDLADLLGRPRRTVTDWNSQTGFPAAVGRREGANFYPLVESLRWIMAYVTNRKQTKSEDELELIRAQTRVHQLRAQKLAGEAIPLKDALSLITKQNSLVRQSLEGIPSRLAPRLTSMTDPVLIEEFIKDELRSALSGLDSTISNLSRGYLEDTPEADDIPMGL